MADAEAEVALAAIEDGDGVEGVQLYVCGSDGELELLALEGKAGGRRWHLKARAADLVTAPNDARYPDQACRIAREAADGCSSGCRGARSSWRQRGRMSAPCRPVSATSSVMPTA